MLTPATFSSDFFYRDWACTAGRVLHIKRLRFIKRAQVLGFTLEEVAGLLQRDEACACTETRDLAAHKLRIIDAKLAGLIAMRKAPADLMGECESSGMNGACPIIHTLAAD